MNLSDDKRTVHLSIDGDLKADDLQDLIAELARVRARMLPAVPNAPISDDLDSAERAEGFAVRTLSDEYIQLLIRDLGLGWLSIALDIGQACTLRDFLVANTPAGHPNPLADLQIDSGDLPQ